MKKLKDNYDAVVIGAGMAGLTCGALLAKNGVDVLVVEQSNRPGGYCGSITAGGFCFDPAVAVLEGCDENGIISRTLEELRIEEELPLIKLDSVGKIIGPDYALTVSRRLEGFKDELKRLAPAEGGHMDDFFEECRALYKEMALVSAGSMDLMGLGQKLGFMKDFLLKCPRLRKYSAKSARGVIESFFTDPKVKSALHGLAIFLDPGCQATILMNMIGLINCEDLFYPKTGGIQALPNALVKSLEGDGGKLAFNTPVTKILLDGKKVARIELKEGEQIKASCIVSAMDGRQTFLKLIGEERLTQGFVRQLGESKVYGSAVSVLLGVDMDLTAEGINVSNLTYCPTNDIGELFCIDPAMCGLSLRFHSLLDPTHAPTGKNTIVIVANFTYESMNFGWWNDGQYVKLKEIVADRLIASAQKVIPHLSESIVYKKVETPLTFEEATGNFQGSAMGWYPLPGGKMRSQKTPIPNLYQAGHWTFPGGSVPAVVASGWNAAQLVLRELR